ncbi:LOW QUALITY PROTEIN: B-cell CLL/lymphoma 9-like protein [Phyllopteryx taeniolatus]|uniref:LOW QUALITY PROTEIN: B-cell CLL/lymphoma 9-like protein n=1 Tax=Phyllopteryx taeniolatus TaxID=161469 RepID=UPI002AD1EDF2|nr:LOW QUALITY PROTEIN: B-cell CLL/lymphoma 9-like protein [Phyllopteryx taeniolatus]
MLPNRNVSSGRGLLHTAPQPSSATYQMHTDNKLANHGEQVTGDARAQMAAVNLQAQQPQQQGAAGHLAPKSRLSAGGHGINKSAPGLKAAGQSSSIVGGMLKTKSKRERSVSVDSGEPRHTATKTMEDDAKAESVTRSKRRCVLEKKQPYSGDEWCSGPDTEDDDDKPRSTTQRERGLPGPRQGQPDHPPAEAAASEPVMACAPGPGLKPGPPLPQSKQQLLYVFTTNMANSAAEAVMKGKMDSILQFHQQNVPRIKLDQGHALVRITEKVNSSASPPTGTPKSKSGTPQPNSAGGVVSSLAVKTPMPEGDGRATPSGPGSGTVHCEGLPVASLSPSGSPSILSAHLQSDTGQRSGPGNEGGLSKEQLEHRERSLQTLRDIERLFLRTGVRGGPHGDTGGSNSNLTNNAPSIINNSSRDRDAILEDGNNGTNSGDGSSDNMALSALASLGTMKKFEEPLQSIISQTESLGTATHSPEMDSLHNLAQHPHPQLSSPGLDMGPLLGTEGLTQEQVAWRKLQEEYYLEKRRQQEIQNPQHFRMMTEMGLHGGPMIIRGPPPPYHSKPGDQQWVSGNTMGGGIPGNVRMTDMHQEGPGRPQFLSHVQRGPPGGAGFPGSPGGLLSVDGLGHQRPTRPGIWLDNMPNNMDGGGSFHGCYPPQHLQEKPEHLLTREELFRITEKRQMQGLPRFELDRIIAQQQQGNMGSRIMENPGGPDFSNFGTMGRGPPSNQGDHMDFPGSRDIMGSPGGGPQIRDLMDSPLASNLSINMNPQLNIQQQHMTLSQKLRRDPGRAGPLSEFFSPGVIARIRASQNERRNMGMVSGPDGPFRFPTQGPFSGGPGEGPYPQQPGPEMFGPEQEGHNQIGVTSRLSHMPITGDLRGMGPGPRHPSDLSVNVQSLTSPTVQHPHHLNSPSLHREPSAHLTSPSAPGQKSPSIIAPEGPHPPLRPASGAGTPCSSSMKSPQIMGSSNHDLHSPSLSPGRLKSPAMAMGSPAWMSPKRDPSSPGGPNSVRAAGNGGSHPETGRSLPPRSSNSTPSSQPGLINPSMTFTSSPDAPQTQNPLSLIMSQMSKYALPSSTPLYHDAIKTIATSDDEMLPDRPLLPGVSIGGNIGNLPTSQILVSQSSIGAKSDSQSPVRIPSQGQHQLSHDPSEPVLSSPNSMGLPLMSSTMMGGGSDDLGPCNISPMSQNQMAAFPRMHPSSHSHMRSPIGRMSHNFSQSGEDILSPQQLHLLGKDPHQRHPHPSESFPPLSMGDGPDLSEVIRPTHSGIPEFDLSRIIPSDKPSSTLQYFPKSEPHQNPNQGPVSQQPPPQQLLKHLSSSCPPHISISNPHLANLQNMMAEQQLPPNQGHSGLGQSMAILHGNARGMVLGTGMGPMCPSGHMLARTGMVPQQQQAMMANSLLHHPSGPYPGMMSPQQQQHNLIARQNMMMMQGKQRNMPIPGDPFSPQGALMSPQGPMMAPSHAQTGLIGPQTLRQRGMSLDSPIGYSPGSMANMPF